MHAFSPCKGPVESFFNFIQNPLGVLCDASPLSVRTHQCAPIMYWERALFLNMIAKRTTSGACCAEYALRLRLCIIKNMISKIIIINIVILELTPK